LCAGQVDLQDLFPGVWVHLCDRRDRACNTGIVHRHIEPTERIDGVRDHAFDVLTAAMMLHVFVTGAQRSRAGGNRYGTVLKFKHGAYRITRLKNTVAA
jgi:hypothetical protein